MAVIECSADSSMMANQVVSSESVQVLTVESFIREYHACMDVWTPVQDETLRLIPEPSNSVDICCTDERRPSCRSCSLQSIPHCLTVLEKGCEQSFCSSYWRESKSRSWIWA